MSKVGLLTSHASMNFGGLLQAYALKETIKEMGYDCEIINYKPEVHDIKKHPVQFVVKRKGFIKKAYFGVTHYRDLKRRMSIFDSFRKEYFEVDDEHVITLEKLSNESKKYDLLCVGSDQLWNLNQRDNENKAYMLDFEHTCPSISYAISFGDGLQKKKNEIIEALPLIKQFRHVSVREIEGKNFLEEHGIMSEHVLDPTLMVNTDFWDRFRGKQRIIKEPYILVYGFENANQKYKDLICAAKRVSKMLNLPVINPVMTPDLSYAGFKNTYDCGPKEFLNLIENAVIVVTNSFHGSIFSASFQTPFIAVISKGSNYDNRKANLLKLLNIEYRGVACDEEWNMDLIMHRKIYDIDKLLEKHRRLSKCYLAEALNDSSTLNDSI